MTKKVFFNTSSGPDSKVHVFEPIRIPAFPKISVFHCSALLQSLLLDVYIYCLNRNEGCQMGSNRSISR